MKPPHVPMVKAVFKEILKILDGPFMEKLDLAGVDKADARKWNTAIFHVLEAFEWNLMNLVDSMEQAHEKSVEELQEWVALTTDITLFQIENALEGILESLDKYIPEDDYDDEDEDEANDA